MTHRNLIRISAVLATLWAWPALAQDAPAPTAPGSESEGDTDTGTEAETEAGTDTGAPSLELTPPKNIDLDMQALGEMDPEKDLAMGGQTRDAAPVEPPPESWTDRELDILELHGYFRLRPQLFDNLSLRGDDALFSRTLENRVTDDSRTNDGEDCRDGAARRSCNQTTMAGADLRFRLEPTLNVSEEVWVKSQIDFLDNLILGSTPAARGGAGQTVAPGEVTGWEMVAPENAVNVRRVWGEVLTPIGQIRFGRMGDEWGMGILHNAGNRITDDYGSSVDRLMFLTKINTWILAPFFDFPGEGAVYANEGRRSFDFGQLDDAYQLGAIIAYKHDAEEQAALLRRGDWVFNTGVYFTYRSQVLSFERDPNAVLLPADAADPTAGQLFYRRDAWNIAPDYWLEFAYDTFHLELEGVFIYGQIGNPDRELIEFDQAESLTLMQYGGALQLDYGLLSNQLRIGLGSGVASGDKQVDGLHVQTSFDQTSNDSTFGAFAFNPAFTTDLILFREVLGTVSQAWYLHPWLRYDFIKNATGRNMGAQIDAVYSRAFFTSNAISNSSGNLGVEIDGSVSYVSEDNFHVGLQYGVFFPLGGLEGTFDADGDSTTTDDRTSDNDLSIAQTLQVFLGISY